MIHILPSKTSFIGNAKAGRISPVYAELPFVSPQTIFEAIQSPNSFLLESIKGPEKIARYSFIGAEPFLVFKVKNGNIEISGQRSAISDQNSKAPLEKLKELITGYKIESPPDLPPFIGGAVGMLSYDFVHYFENIPRTAVDDLNIPDAHFMLIDTVIAVDHKLQKTFIISCPLHGKQVQKCKSAKARKRGSAEDNGWGARDFCAYHLSPISYRLLCPFPAFCRACDEDEGDIFHASGCDSPV